MITKTIELNNDRISEALDKLHELIPVDLENISRRLYLLEAIGCVQDKSTQAQTEKLFQNLAEYLEKRVREEQARNLN